MRVTTFSGALFLAAACGSAPTRDPETPTAPATEAKSAPEPAAETSDEKKAEPAADDGKIPTACAKQTDICTMPKKFVDRLCQSTFPNVALVLFSSGAPWTHGYLTRKTEAWNAEGGASKGGFVEFDEEVLLLTSHAPPKDGMQVSGAGGYQALRWDGSCVTLSSEEVTMKRPPSPKHPRIEWRFIEDGMRDSLRKDSDVDAAAIAVKKECKGVSVGDVSKKCVEADNRLVDAIIKRVQSSSDLPTPAKLPEKGPDTMNPSGKVALVTGGASGLGAATVRALVSKGARVAVVDKSIEPGKQLASELGSAVLLIEADVTDDAKLGSVFERVKKELGGLHVAVGCAGIGTAGRVVGKSGLFPLELFELTLRVNLVGMFNMIRHAAGAMSENTPDEGGERGVIVTTASIAAFDGQIGQAAYSASKAGVVGMTLPIARELARFGVRVVTIAPGTFDTPMLANLPEESRRSLAAGIPFPNRLGNPAEFAALATHIVENAMINGETIRIDGALRMAPK